MVSAGAPSTAFYGPVNPALLGGFDWEEEVSDAGRPAGAGVASVATGAGSGRQGPTETALERQAPPAEGDIDDFGFGHRYRATQGEIRSAVVVTNQRWARSALTGDRLCIICAETKPVSDFPAAAITRDCRHEPHTCLACVVECIRTDLNYRVWDDIRCPECRAMLEYVDIQRYADDECKERLNDSYQNLSFRTALSSSPTFFWCPDPSCDHGQDHPQGDRQPLVVCRQCSRRWCFRHLCPWHTDFSCDDWDAFLADPEGYRGGQFPGVSGGDERVRVEREEAEERAAAQRGVEERRAAEERREAEERRRREQIAQRERVARERWERELREVAARRRREEEASRRMVGRSTKPCPGCKAPIEKNSGCSHMTCIKCGYQFCWGCNARWDKCRNIKCVGRR